MIATSRLARDANSEADFELELKKLEETLKDLHATLETPRDDVFIVRKSEDLKRHGFNC